MTFVANSFHILLIFDKNLHQETQTAMLSQKTPIKIVDVLLTFGPQKVITQRNCQ